MQTSYSTKPEGLPGNDDFGALSAWYVWAALGLYPMPGTTTYILGSPSFTSATILFPQGTLQILAHNASTSNVYIERAEVNGRPIDMAHAAFVDHADLVLPGKLEFWMTSQGPTWAPDSSRK